VQHPIPDTCVVKVFVTGGCLVENHVSSNHNPAVSQKTRATLASSSCQLLRWKS
jgi:hypothetical protein